MPSAITPDSSAACASTQLWPIEATGSLPVCFSVTLKLLQVLGTVMDLTLYCIASLASTVVLHSAAISGEEARASRARTISLRMGTTPVGKLMHPDSAQAASGRH